MFLKIASYMENVNPEKRLLSYQKAMVEQMSRETAATMLVESSKLKYVKCGFGDTSGGRFGVTMKGEAVLDTETDTWNALGTQKSSNFIELSNFVYNLEKDATEGKLTKPSCSLTIPPLMLLTTMEHNIVQNCFNC